MAKKQVPFYTESSKKSISLGNGERDHFYFSDKKKKLSHIRIVQDNRIFMFWSLSSPFLIKNFWKYSLYMSLQPNSLKISCSSTAKN